MRVAEKVTEPALTLRFANWTGEAEATFTGRGNTAVEEEEGTSEFRRAKKNGIESMKNRRKKSEEMSRRVVAVTSTRAPRKKEKVARKVAIE